MALTAEDQKRLLELVLKHQGEEALKKVPDLDVKKQTRLLALLDEMERQASWNNFHRYAENYIKIVDKKGNTIPLRENYAQKRIGQLMSELKSQGKPPRIIVLKSRQMGASTGIQGRMCHECFTKENRRGFIVSHEDESTQTIFRKAKYMLDNLPENVKPLQRASNRSELILDTPITGSYAKKGLNSLVKVKTAGDTGLGRSDTLNYVHLSEYGFYKGSGNKSPNNQLTGIMQAVPDDLDTWVIIESTANGYNDFKQLWDDAVAGKNAFEPLFLVWYEHDEYYMHISNDEKEEFIETMSTYEREMLYETLDLPLGRIKWWRYTLKYKCNGNLNQMKQENPTTPEEAFLFSGTPVFDVERVQKRIEYLRKLYEQEPYLEGYFEFKWHEPDYKDYIVDNTIKFIPSNSKPLIRIYEEPQTLMPYVIGGDTKGEGSDFYAGTVIDNSTGKRVGALHVQLTNSKQYSWQMYCLGKYYNDALVGIEMNFNTAPIEELDRLGYFNQYLRRKFDDFSKKFEKKFGWKTDGNTRPVIIDKEIDLIENNIELYYDIPTLQEHMGFVYDDNGRPDAMSGHHDDLLMSEMIANQIREQQRTATVIEEDDIDFSKLPEDYVEDYRRANDKLKTTILKHWKDIGLI